jgi:hypothetical protein
MTWWKYVGFPGSTVPRKRWYFIMIISILKELASCHKEGAVLTGRMFETG